MACHSSSSSSSTTTTRHSSSSTGSKLARQAGSERRLARQWCGCSCCRIVWVCVAWCVMAVWCCATVCRCRFHKECTGSFRGTLLVSGSVIRFVLGVCVCGAAQHVGACVSVSASCCVCPSMQVFFCPQIFQNTLSVCRRTPNQSVGCCAPFCSGWEQYCLACVRGG